MEVKSIFKEVGIVIGILLTIFLLTMGGLINYKFFAPKFENARREVFENTRSYNQAKIQELSKYKAEYERANKEDKAVTIKKQILKNIVRHKFADYSDNNLPYGLRTFLKEMRGY